MKKKPGAYVLLLFSLFFELEQVVIEESQGIILKCAGERNHCALTAIIDYQPLWLQWTLSLPALACLLT